MERLEWNRATCHGGTSTCCLFYLFMPCCVRYCSLELTRIWRNDFSMYRDVINAATKRWLNAAYTIVGLTRTAIMTTANYNNKMCFHTYVWVRMYIIVNSANCVYVTSNTLGECQKSCCHHAVREPVNQPTDRRGYYNAQSIDMTPASACCWSDDSCAIVPVTYLYCRWGSGENPKTIIMK